VREAKLRAPRAHGCICPRRDECSSIKEKRRRKMRSRGELCPRDIPFWSSDSPTKSFSKRLTRHSLSPTVETRRCSGRSSGMPERSQIIVVLLHHPTISLRAGNLAVASSGTWISLHRRDRSAIQGRSTGSTSAISSGKSGAQACSDKKRMRAEARL